MCGTNDLYFFSAVTDFQDLSNVVISLSTSRSLSCINITALIDEAIELTEVFFVVVEPNDDAVSIANNVAIVVIQDQTDGSYFYVLAKAILGSCKSVAQGLLAIRLRTWEKLQCPLLGGLCFQILNCSLLESIITPL